MDKYRLGRALAAAQDAKLDGIESAFEMEQEIAREIEAAGGWDDETDRGYRDARSEYAQERL